MDHSITTAKINIEDLKKILQEGRKIKLSAESAKQVKACRDYLDKKIPQTESPVYGVNTGFGSLCNVRISDAELEQLQYNLLVSHACGTGDRVPADIVKLMLLLKVQSLSYGHSGVASETVERLIEFFNNDILPVVYEQGSLGASGDLAPLAHLSLPLLGLGKLSLDGQDMDASQLNYTPLKLRSKEGLALLNGTQFMSAYGCYLLIHGMRLWELCNRVAALSIDAFDCKSEPFHPLLHKVRPHAGQQHTASYILDTLDGSEIFNRRKEQVQDPYSFRCIPQVHGASYDILQHVMQIFETEINSVTDNPNVFPDEDMILSGGNFHGQTLAMALDYLGIALSELGSISERRTYLLISGQRGLPPFLAKEAGLNSGFMIPQYTAASIASQNKQLCSPASADSIPSSNGQEDHVSMGANAATKCLRILKNTRRILAIELMTAAQALSFRRPARSSAKIEKLLSAYREVVPEMENDRYLHEDIEKSIHFLEREDI